MGLENHQVNDICVDYKNTAKGDKQAEDTERKESSVPNERTLAEK